MSTVVNIWLLNVLLLPASSDRSPHLDYYRVALAALHVKEPATKTMRPGRCGGAFVTLRAFAEKTQAVLGDHVVYS